jgi:hypothetical protein
MTASETRPGPASGLSARTRLQVVPAWSVEVGLVAAFYLVYETLRAERHPAAAVALARGRAIAHAEHWLHLGVERPLNNFAATHLIFADACGYYYATLHFAVTPLMLAWLWHRRPAAYQPWRRTLSVATVLALAAYWLLPVAPPRLALPAMTDTVVARNILHG